MSESELPGIRNGHVVDSRLLRGGDITPEGIETLVHRGVRLVICLKNYNDDDRIEILTEQRRVEQAGMEFKFAPLENSGWFGYRDIKLVPAILDLISTANEPVFVGCHRGSDRTSIIVSCYRIREYGWEAEQAIDESREFGWAWYNHGQREAVRNFKP